VEDVERTYVPIGAPFSESTARAAIEAYSESFNEEAVLWHTTDRPDDALNFRFYECHPTDNVGISIQAGFIKADSDLVRLINSWGSLNGGILE